MGFSKDFLWGAASAAPQIEGAYNEDGKGPSVWDAMIEGHIAHGDTGRVACDHYHRYKEDVALMKEIGLNAYRFSVAWSRVIPEEGKVNQKGLEFYSDLVDELLAAGIKPLVTLYHWDMPMWIQDKGGWLTDTVSDDFADYVKVVVDALSDRVSCWMTFNEWTSFVGEGYIDGNHPPYIRVERETEAHYSMVVNTTRNLLLSHAKAAAVIRENSKLMPQVGFASDSTLYMPESENAKDIEIAKEKTFSNHISHYLLNWWLDPIMKGSAHPRLKAVLTDENMAIINQPIDFLGWNCYMAHNYADGPDGRMQTYWPGIPRTNMGTTVTKDALYWGVRFIYERYNIPIMITENGISITDFVFDDGKVHDPQRVQHMTWYLRGLKRAADEGCPVLGYMHWSILDNFEWAFGFDQRFGLVYVDYLTQQRIPKDSAYWYTELIRTNGEFL